MRKKWESRLRKLRKGRWTKVFHSSNRQAAVTYVRILRESSATGDPLKLPPGRFEFEARGNDIYARKLDSALR